jgi:hypothetical protein
MIKFKFLLISAYYEINFATYIKVSVHDFS